VAEGARLESVYTRNRIESSNLSLTANSRSIAQFGSASGLGPEGRGFESLCSDHLILPSFIFLYFLLGIYWQKASFALPVRLLRIT
jgi:hypothetical protein